MAQTVLFLGDMDPIVLFVLGLILVFIFFVYLLVRRSAQQFKQGVDRGKKQ